mmetsp:Transcript_49009/g.115130  ORF Transcript_49009/g.115130 Transcript_49009/m.115130 type:complete len:287 (+) Transcript_49009:1876-2736(+)
MQCRHHAFDRQISHRRQRMRMQFQRGRAAPGTLNGDVDHVIAHQLADAGCAVDMRNDLEQIVRGSLAAGHGFGIHRAVLEAHGARGHPDRAVIERADQSINFDREMRGGQLLRKPPEFAPAGDWRMVVQIHRMQVVALDTLVFNRNHLAGFRVITKAGRVRHADEFVLHHRLGHLQGLRHHGAQRVQISLIRDDQEFAVDESIRTRRKCRVRQRHGKGARQDFRTVHTTTPWGKRDMPGTGLGQFGCQVIDRHTVVQCRRFEPIRVVNAHLHVPPARRPVHLHGRA